MNNNIKLLEANYILKEVIYSSSEANNIKARLHKRHSNYKDSDIIVRRVSTGAYQLWVHEHILDRFGKFKN